MRNLPYIFFSLSIIGFGLVIYDSLFPGTKQLSGVVVEKIYVPSRLATGQTTLGGVRHGHYFVTAQKSEQYVVIVGTEERDTVQVHCHVDHYDQMRVGDKLQFKKYEGDLFHIKYFASQDNEEVQVSAMMR